MAADFLNADLEIVSDKPLDFLCKEIGDRAFTLYCGPYTDGKFLAAFEVDAQVEDGCRVPDGLMQRFCHLFGDLSKESALLWNEACSRVIDLGYEANDGSERLVHSLTLDTLQRLCELRIEINITLYPQGIVP